MSLCFEQTLLSMHLSSPLLDCGDLPLSPSTSCGQGRAPYRGAGPEKERQGLEQMLLHGSNRGLRNVQLDLKQDTNRMGPRDRCVIIRLMFFFIMK